MFNRGFSQSTDASRIVTADSGLNSSTVNSFYRRLNYSNNEVYVDNGNHIENMAYSYHGGDGPGCVGSSYPEVNSSYTAQAGQRSITVKARPSTLLPPKVRTDLPRR